MAIPTLQQLMLPMLEELADGRTLSMRELIDRLAERFGLTEDERNEMLRSGSRRFDNHVWFARLPLVKAGLIESPERGMVRITPTGKEVLKEVRDGLTFAYLERFPVYREWRERSRKKTRPRESLSLQDEFEGEDTPEEKMHEAYRQMRDALAEELQERVRHVSPAFFERLVVELLVRMGYGGTFEDAARAVGRSGDEGIDGIIKEDRLGLDVVYIQAKRWNHPVGRPEIQKFAGALQGHRAKKGVFITTSSFTKEARAYVERIDTRIVLVDGKTLAELMIDHGVGVSTVATYPVQRVDHDFFEEGA